MSEPLQAAAGFRYFRKMSQDIMSKPISTACTAAQSPVELLVWLLVQQQHGSWTLVPSSPECFRDNVRYSLIARGFVEIRTTTRVILQLLETESIAILMRADRNSYNQNPKFEIQSFSYPCGSCVEFKTHAHSGMLLMPLVGSSMGTTNVTICRPLGNSFLPGMQKGI